MEKQDERERCNCDFRGYIFKEKTQVVFILYSCALKSKLKKNIISAFSPQKHSKDVYNKTPLQKLSTLNRIRPCHYKNEYPSHYFLM